MRRFSSPSTDPVFQLSPPNPLPTGVGSSQVSAVPGIGCIQSMAFLLHTDCTWDTPDQIVCRPLKIFGWNHYDRAFTLDLFDATNSNSSTYAEVQNGGNCLLLYQCHPEAQICYVYQPQYEDQTNFRPVRYQMKVFICIDNLTWDLIAEGEYR